MSPFIPERVQVEWNFGKLVSDFRKWATVDVPVLQG
jgi:hypothetical protein